MLKVVLSCLIVVLAYIPPVQWTKLVTTVECIGEGERSICTLTHVCYWRKDRHVLYGSISGYTTPHLLAYLIATDLFPQSAIYLLSSEAIPEHSQPSAHTSFLMHRFKPDNIMHVLHDDILPIYAVLRKMFPASSAPFPVTLVFADEYGPMPYDELYERLVADQLVYNSNGSCFDRLLVGFDKSTLWYQYGFTSPQSPLPHNATHISTLIADYVGHREHVQTHQVTLFSRQETRRIINEAKLMVGIAREFSISVKAIDLDTNSFTEVVDAVSRSSVVIGMHGALFAAMMWMPKGAAVVEMFPYSVNPDSYTPYKTLAGILNITYLPWVNTDVSKTVGHADYPKEYGGLQHLSLTEQAAIMSETEVKQHLCCDHPSWLYHIYQDTVVDVEDILDLLRQAFPLTPTAAEI